MRFSNRIASVLCVAAVLLPIGAGAAKIVTLRDLSAIVQANKKPLAFEMTAKGTYGKGAGTITVKGVQNGDVKTLAKAATDVSVVLEGSDGAGSSGRATFRMILVKATAYARLEQLEATGEWAAYIDDAEPYLQEWYSFPVDPEEYDAYLKNNARTRTASTKEIDAFLSIVVNELRDGKTEYVITIPKAKQRRLLSRLFGPGHSRTYKSPSLDVRFTVETMGNIFHAMSGTASMKATVDGVKGSMGVTAKTSALKTPPVISAPSESTPWEEFVESQSALLIEDARNAQRKSDVNTILIAVYQYAIDNKGNFPQTLLDAGTDEVSICKTGVKTCDGISLDILAGSYLISLPTDPQQNVFLGETGYRIRVDSMGRVTVSAPNAENDVTISVTR